jgi:hypothetical protein
MRRATLLVVAALACTACMGTTESTTFSSVGEELIALPADCEAQITDFLVAIEPVVAEIDFETASEAEIEAIGEATIPAAENFDPDVCPDFDEAEARQAWLQIAEREAPGTVGYVEYTYPAD